MKKLLLFLFTAMRLSICVGQTNSNVKTCLFYIDNNPLVLCKIDNAVAGEISYFSKPTGGKLLASENVTPFSEVLHSFELNKIPAFVLFNKNCYQIGEYEFSLKEITSQIDNGFITIQFDAKSKAYQNTTYQLVRIASDGSKTNIASFSNLQDDAFEHFGITTMENSISIEYRLEVSHVDEGLRYSLPIALSENSNRNAKNTTVENYFRIFPTLSHDEINVFCSDKYIGASYQIVDAIGRKVKSGKVFSNKETCSISNLYPGNYYFVLTSNGNKDLTRFQKY